MAATLSSSLLVPDERIPVDIYHNDLVGLLQRSTAERRKIMDKDTRYHMALGILNALIYEGSDKESELRAAMMLLDPQPDDDMEWAEQTASAVLVAWSDSMLRTIHDLDPGADKWDSMLEHDN
jgi:hypothetical protein